MLFAATYHIRPGPPSLLSARSVLHGRLGFCVGALCRRVVRLTVKTGGCRPGRAVLNFSGILVCSTAVGRLVLTAPPAPLCPVPAPGPQSAPLCSTGPQSSALLPAPLAHAWSLWWTKQCPRHPQRGRRDVRGHRQQQRRAPPPPPHGPPHRRRRLPLGLPLLHAGPGAGLGTPLHHGIMPRHAPACRHHPTRSRESSSRMISQRVAHRTTLGFASKFKLSKPTMYLQ